MKLKLLILASLFAVLIIFSGCAKKASDNGVPAVIQDNTVSQDKVTQEVTNSISDADNLTSLDDATLDQNLGAADKTLADW